MLPKPRTVVDRIRLAGWASGSGVRARAGALRIEITGADPRIVLVPRVWIERASEPAGDIASGVSWSAFSAGFDSNKNLVPLKVVEGAASRPLRASAAADGTIPQGDNLELQTATPIILVISCADVSGTVPHSAAQSLWFALEAYPADPSQSPGDFDGLLHLIRCSQPPALALVAHA